MKAYIDTSALGTIVLQDDGWRKLAQWLRANAVEATISDFCWGELTSAVGIRVRMKAMTPERGNALLRATAAYLDGWTWIPIASADIADATAMVSDFPLALRLPDAIHLAAARRVGIVLISTNARQVRAAQALGIAAINPVSADGDLS